MGADHNTTDQDDFGGLQRDGLSRVDRRQASQCLAERGSWVCWRHAPRVLPTTAAHR